MRQAIIGILVVTTMLSLAAPALAGGWATVRLDAPPGDIVANEPWQLGFMVLQHDITPNSDVTPVLRALHKETGEEVTASGEQEGGAGHFFVEVTFSRAGEWKWAIEPLPYAETSFETLTVHASLGARAYPANILSGSCAAPGDVAFPLSEVEPQTMDAKTAQLPVAVGVSTIGASLPELLAAEHAIGIGSDASGAAPVACADIAPVSEDPSEVVLGLRGGTTAENIGVAVLRDADGQTAVTLYLMNPNVGAATREDTLTVATETMTIDILDAFFAPFSVEAAVGEPVTWVNSSTMAHTVTGDDLAFDDSGLIEPGASFSITFDEPGTFHYRCGPHPGMVGEIVVA